MTTHADIIERLGGYRAVADGTGRNLTTVSNWKRLGIPARAWVPIVALAEAKGVTVTFETLARSTPDQA